jgi:hypothetical protein
MRGRFEKVGKRGFFDNIQNLKFCREINIGH